MFDGSLDVDGESDGEDVGKSDEVIVGREEIEGESEGDTDGDNDGRNDVVGEDEGETVGDNDGNPDDDGEDEGGKEGKLDGKEDIEGEADGEVLVVGEIVAIMSFASSAIGEKVGARVMFSTGAAVSSSVSSSHGNLSFQSSGMYVDSFLSVGMMSVNSRRATNTNDPTSMTKNAQRHGEQHSMAQSETNRMKLKS